MRYGTVCSGVEAVSLAWEPLGFIPQFFSEVEAFPKAVLAHHWPDVPDLGDLLEITGEDWRGNLDIFWGSTPCQAFSSAGKRRSLSDPRGALSLKFVDLADQIDAPYTCWENVKGALNADHNAFGCLLGALSGEDDPVVPAGTRWTNAGYVLGPRRAVAWRLFDAQYSGLPQRRERLFIVACPRGGADPREILFEEVEGREIARPRERTREELAEALGSSAAGRAFAVAFRGRDGGERCEVGGEVSFCLRTAQGGSDKAFALVDDGVQPSIRRLTVLECERLMGFPEHHTEVPINGKNAAEGMRLKAIGNSVAVPDVRWIGERIASSFRSKIL